MRLIDADALIDETFKRYCNDCNRRKGIKNGKYRILYEIGEAPCRACETGDMIDELENAPTIEPEQKTGKWTVDNACPFCGFQPWYERDIHTLSFCPNCGARMTKGV